MRSRMISHDAVFKAYRKSISAGGIFHTGKFAAKTFRIQCKCAFKNHLANHCGRAYYIPKLEYKAIAVRILLQTLTSTI
jgi:hypothetical protein